MLRRSILSRSPNAALRRRLFSTPSPHTPAPKTASESAGKAQTTASESTSDRARIDRLNARLPRFLHSYTTPLLSAPVTHITSFLLLHELTAVVPLFGLVAFFHYTNWLPPYFAEGKWIANGVEKFGRYFRRKGWLSEVEKRETEELVKDGSRKGEDGKRMKWWQRRDGKWKEGKISNWWGNREGRMRLVVEFGTAYAITKALLPLRLVLSVWATPWFARWTVIPAMNGFKGVSGLIRNSWRW